MNRRSFLKAFTGGVAGAGVLAYTPTITAAPEYFTNYSLFGWHQSLVMLPLEDLIEMQSQAGELRKAYYRHLYRYGRGGIPFDPTPYLQDSPPASATHPPHPDRT